MNRKILFRGKSTIDGNWVYGFLNYAEQQNIYYIGFTELMTPVITETVGQFTGLTDKNGVKIFEGDILGVDHYKLIIEFKGGQFVGINVDKNHPIRETQNRNWLSWTITGNIHDNK